MEIWERRKTFTLNKQIFFFIFLHLPSDAEIASYSRVWIWFGPIVSLPLVLPLLPLPPLPSCCVLCWCWCCCLFLFIGGLTVVWMYGVGVVVGFGGKRSSAFVKMQQKVGRGRRRKKSFRIKNKRKVSCTIN